MSEPTVICPECVRVVRKDNLEDAEDLRNSHNDSRHDGDHVAKLSAEFRLADHDLEDHEIRKIVKETKATL